MMEARRGYLFPRDPVGRGSGTLSSLSDRIPIVSAMRALYRIRILKDAERIQPVVEALRAEA